MIVNEISRGITHIEDLSVDKFYDTLKNLSDYEITEKVDGAQLLFGLDEYGFYTSRETKGGKRIYAVEDYDISFPTTYMRSAHMLLESVLPELKSAGLRIGDQVEAEALFGELPNVVPYSPDQSYMIFLRVTEGTANIDKLDRALCQTSHLVKLMAPITKDGRSIHLSEDSSQWKFTRVPKIAFDSNSITETIKHSVFALTKYLRSPSGISEQPVRVIESLPLNKRPEWCEPSDWKITKEIVKEEKHEIDIKVSGLKAVIKEHLLNHFVRSRGSSFGPLVEDGGWIEGVVLRHKSSGKMVKIVDKDVFGTVREAAWEKRNKLTEHAKSITSELSFMGELYVKMATALGHPTLGTIQAKSYLRRAGQVNEERITSLTTGLNVSAIKDYWLNLFSTKLIQLEEDLDKYEKEENSSCPVPERCRAAIDKRTTESFATAFVRINELETETRRAVSASDLLTILVGKQLDNLT
jgi:hypothetical protein